MKTFEKSELNLFLERLLIPGLFLGTDFEYSRIHDDCEGNYDQCIKITIREDDLGNEFFELRTPSTPGLRFRNYFGGGASLRVHNALKVLIYSTFCAQDLFLPGLEHEELSRDEILREIDDILDGQIVLPPEVFAQGDLHYYFEITPHLKVAISVDGDTHILTEPTTAIDDQIESETCYWNPEPFVFHPDRNCSRATFNALTLLTIAIEQSN